MRKYIIGCFVGICLSFAVGAHAEVVTLVGKAIEGTTSIKLNGVKLDKDVLIVDGSSYAPVRAIGETLGLDVDFKNGEVIMNDKPKEVKPVVVTPDKTESLKPSKTIEQLNSQIESIKVNMHANDMGIITLKEEMAKNPTQKADYEKSIQLMLDDKTKKELQIADLEKQKAELQK